MTTTWTNVGLVTDIPQRGARVVNVNGMAIAVFRTGEDKILAVEDRCPHRGGPLSQGIVYGESVACPLHGWVIELDSGNARAPDVGCVRKFDVRVENEIVYLDIGAAASVLG